MQRASFLALALAAWLAGCAGMPGPFAGGWQTLIDGERGLENFVRVGDANWRAEGGAIVADRAATSGFLVTKKSYRDFQLRAEFYAEDTTNSGIFIRASDPARILDTNSYEVNIFDQRPDPTYGTGGIVNFARVQPIYKAGGKWNTYDVTVKGSTIVVTLNGVQTVTMNDSKFAQGPFALQFANRGPLGAGGAIKWRKVQVREL